ncbi:MAG: hypothetical protein LE178_06835, partial [Endomicrobium sp.]|nr:hypothetical protein [Endomicrobium sp.]
KISASLTETSSASGISNCCNFICLFSNSERYEKYLSELENKQIKLQQLLIPEALEVSVKEAEILKSNVPILNETGLKIDQFGEVYFRITALPALLGDIEASHIVKSIISDIEDEKVIGIERKIDIIIRSACRASVKAGDKLSFDEIKKLISDLFKCLQPLTCPHGRPVAYKISLNELEKFFKRV